MALGRKSVYTRPLARIAIDEAVTSLDDTLVEQGQSIRDKADYKVDDKGSGLWVARLANIETEIQLNGRKLKDYNCDCSAFAKHQICEHLAALLGTIHVRKRPTRKNPSTVSRRQSVSVKKLIAGLDEYQLREFVTQYAQKHPDFVLDLKVKFAQDLPIANRFEQVIKNLLKRTGKVYSPKQTKRIYQALEHFEEQRELWLADKSYLDLFELNTTLVPMLAVIVDKLSSTKLDLAAYLSACINELGVIVDAAPAPVILERIESWIEEQLDRGVYYRLDVDTSFYSVLNSLGEEFDALEARLHKANESYGVSTARLVALTKLYYESDQADEAEKLLLDHLDQGELVAAALQEEVAKGNYRRGIKLAEAAYARQENPKEKLRLTTFIVQAAALAKRESLLVTYAPRLTLELNSLELINQVFDDQELSAEVYENTYNAIRSELESRPATPDTIKLLAQTLLKLRDGKAVEALAYRSDNAYLLADVLPEMVGLVSVEDFKLLLDTKVREQLDSRFGKSPANWVVKLLDGVARRSRKDNISDIVRGLRRDYKQRTALIDALDDALL